MLEAEKESPNDAGYGKCGNCQVAFQKKSSKVTQIIVDVNDESQEDVIISIYEALSVIFEIPPLTPNEAVSVESEEEGSRVTLTKKDIFKNGSQFTTSNCSQNEVSTGNSGHENDRVSYGICINCSEILKALYKNFQSFTKVCKLESDIGKILWDLEKTGSSASREADNTENCSFYEIITVKTEQIESEEEQESDSENDNQVDGQKNGSEAASNDGEDGTLIPKLSPQAPESDNDDLVDMPGSCSPDEEVSGNEEEQNLPPPSSPENTEPRRNLRERRAVRQIIESEDEEVSHARNDQGCVPKSKRSEEGPQRVSIKVTNGRGIITQLKCPKCNKQFLHENTLICHRRIIHRENIKIQPPTPLPQLKLTKQGNAERLTALADANGKTSVCPICRLDVPRTGIRQHLSNHTRSISKPWLCTICGRNFNNQASLNEHARSHIYGIPCKRCGKKIPTLEMLNHIRRCIAKPGHTLDFSCKVCQKMFHTSDQLIQHRAKVHGHFWKCKLCGIKFRQREQMQRHMNTHKQKKSHKCKICDKSFDRIDVLRLHIKRFHRNNEGPPSVQRSVALETGDGGAEDFFSDHDSLPVRSPSPPQATNETQIDSSPENSSEKKNISTAAETVSGMNSITPIHEHRYSCKGCAQTFPRVNELDAHLLEVHTEEESLMCKICNRKLQDRYCLKLHVKTHGETKPLECFHLNCGKVYRDKNTFFYHLKEKHGMDTKSIIVKYPDVFRQKNKDYSSRYARKRIGQMPSVPKRGKFPCEVCGRTFTQIYALRNHVKLVHDKVKDYLCKYCGKAFARKSYFMLHEKLHTSNEAPYKCHLCNKGFRLPGNLRMHLQSTIHNPNRDFVCDICGKGFNRNDNLRLHVKTVHLKIPIRKSKSQSSDRYAHGGRNRIYIGSGTDVDKANNPSNPSSGSFGTPSSHPVPGTSHSFVSQQDQQHHQQSPSAFQRHTSVFSHVDSSSMDSSSHFSGDGGGDLKRSPVEEIHHRTQQHHEGFLSMPSLHLHPQDGRDSADSGQHPFPQTDYTVRSFQYR